MIQVQELLGHDTLITPTIGEKIMCSEKFKFYINYNFILHVGNVFLYDLI